MFDVKVRYGFRALRPYQDDRPEWFHSDANIKPIKPGDAVPCVQTVIIDAEELRWRDVKEERPEENKLYLVEGLGPCLAGYDINGKGSWQNVVSGYTEFFDDSCLLYRPFIYAIDAPERCDYEP